MIDPAFGKAACRAWVAGERGDIPLAMKLYTEAERRCMCAFPARLNILRHTAGHLTEPCGVIENIEATEESVYSLWRTDAPPERSSPAGLQDISLSVKNLTDHIKAYIEMVQIHVFREMLQPKPHVLFLSTGRCGTMSLYYLLKQDPAFLPYHTYWFHGPNVARWEAMCRFVSGNFSSTKVFSEWAAMRAAEWLGAESTGRLMAGLNHMDTIFAPVFAALHPESRFVYLSRESRALFRSLFGKGQWSDQQLLPIRYAFDPHFKWHRPAGGWPAQIAWYIRFTDVFTSAMRAALGNRMISVQSESLFNRDESAISRLLWHIGSTLSVDAACKHFETRINEKAHKAEAIPTRAWQDFEEALYW